MGIKAALISLTIPLAALAAPIDVLDRRGNLPTPIDAATARQYLSKISTQAESNSPAYARSYFKTWDTISGTCNTREYVLKRDGSNVQTASDCSATAGAWYSDYDGATWYAASDVDIDHLVPLKEAWVSGAQSWTASQRESFANDITRPQLLAVTDSVNDAKGDRDLAKWLPPRTTYHCTYVRAWIQVKHYYGLSMDSAEKSAALNVLNTRC